VVFVPTMTDVATVLDAPELPGAPHDLEFFLDPMCPFAWQTSVWIRQVAGLRGLRVGWRFISLRLLNEEIAHHDLTDERRATYLLGTRVLRLCAAARERAGNDAVDAIYEGWGRRLWYSTREGRGFGEARNAITAGIDFAELVSEAGLPADLVAAAEDESYDDVIKTETLLALARAGDDLGTPIITFGPDGNSFFGPVISHALPDDVALDLYDSISTLAKFACFSELKRSKRPMLDLPLITG
jgi:hypothetical protein